MFDTLRETIMRYLFVTLSGLALAIGGPCEAADEKGVGTLVADVIAQAGGEAKLLKNFRLRERVLIQETPAPPPRETDANRTSTIEVGGRWWIGTQKRDKDKVRILCYAWSLRILLDPSAKIAALGEAKVAEKSALGLRVTNVAKDPVDLWFDKASLRLLAIDYADTRHVFSDWAATSEGHHYPKHVTGYRFVDVNAKTVRDKQWYQTDLIEVTPLQDLPAELK